MTNDFLKTILLIVIVVAVIGAAFWFISDKYPVYAAKKEVVNALKDIANAYKRFGTSADQTVTMDLLTGKEWVILDKETKDHWYFELVGDPPTLIIATSNPSMPGGRDRVAKCDIASGKIWGWGTGIGEDSTKTEK